jgi:6-phosphogluconolactonase (cycloisomerase 2 family)
VLVCFREIGVTAPVATSAPFVVIVPYFAVFGDIRRSNSVSVYKSDAATGALMLAAHSPVASGRDPRAGTLGPGGRFAYVVNKGSNTVSVYKVDASTAGLMPVTGSPFAVDYSSSGPTGITVDSAGTHAYVVSDAGVFAFSIDATTGALVRVPGSPFAKIRSDGFGTKSIALDPNDRFGYVLNSFSNTLSTYRIDVAGTLIPEGSGLEAGQNSNDPGSFDSVRIDPQGKYAYVTGHCCVYVYAIDATTGALAAPAHLSLDLPESHVLTDFAIDPTGEFAYAADDLGRLYAYAIDSKTGSLKKVASRRPHLRLAADPDTYSLTIDPTGKFAYVFGPGSRVFAPTISAYRIDSSTGEPLPIARAPITVASNSTDPIARWFNAGRCAKFDETLGADSRQPPLVKRDSEGVIFDRLTATTRGYFYDPKNRSALRYPNTDSGGTFTLRISGPPPDGVARHDLSTLHTASGIKLGSSAKAVVTALGKPKVIEGCDLQRYVYTRSAMGEPTYLEFTIRDGQVIEIFEDFGG